MHPHRKILPRNAVQVTKEYVELRVSIDLPVRELLCDEGVLYVVDGHRAQDIFYEEMMEIIGSSLLYCNMDHPQVETFVHAMDNADRLRQHLNATGQVAFLAEGSLVERDGLLREPNYVGRRPFADRGVTARRSGDRSWWRTEGHIHTSRTDCNCRG